MFANSLGHGVRMPASATERACYARPVPEICKDSRAKGLKLKPAQISDLTGFPMGARCALGWLHAFFSFAARAGRDQSSLRMARSIYSTQEMNISKTVSSFSGFHDEIQRTGFAYLLSTVDVDDVTDAVTWRFYRKGLQGRPASRHRLKS